jgi:isopenicillin-N N-acyltransferase like protein
MNHANRMRLVELLCAICAALSLVLSVLEAEQFRYPEGKHGRGELRYHQNIPVLVVRGTHTEMGDQMGTLALKPAIKAMQLVDGYAERHIPSTLRPIADAAMQSIYSSFPSQYRRELEAMAEAAGAAKQSLITANTVIDLQEIIGCSSVLISADRSATDAPLYGRNMDMPYVDGLAEFSLLVVYVPEKGHSFAMPNLPGFLMLASAMNDSGLALGSQSVGAPSDGSPRFNTNGLASAVVARRLMEECSGVDSAEEWLEKNRLFRCVSIAACDTKQHVVFEVTTERVLKRGDQEAVSCATNHFRSKELAGEVVCTRYSRLENLKNLKEIDLVTILSELDAVNQGKLTVHSMVFEPRQLRMHLAMGPGPITGTPYTMIELSEYFHRN